MGKKRVGAAPGALRQVRKEVARKAIGTEKELRRELQGLLKGVVKQLEEAYSRHGDKLDFGALRLGGEYDGFIRELEERALAVSGAMARKTRALVQGIGKQCAEELGNGGGKESSPGLMDTLQRNRGELVKGLKSSVELGLMNGDDFATVEKRLARQLDQSYNKALRTLRTESHRAQEQGLLESALALDREAQEENQDIRLVKRWVTQKDNRVRPYQGGRKGKKGRKRGGEANHVQCDGQLALVDQPFDLGNGIKAMAPGLSGDPANDINCRCRVEYQFMEEEAFFQKTGRRFYDTLSVGELDQMAAWTPDFGNVKNMKIDRDLHIQIKPVTNSKFDIWVDKDIRHKDPTIGLVAKHLKELQGQLPEGARIPRVVILDFKKNGLRADGFGGTRYDLDTIFLNRASYSEGKIGRFQREKPTWMANKTKHAVIRHELGHIYHYDLAKDLAKKLDLDYNRAKALLDGPIEAYVHRAISDDPNYLYKILSGYGDNKKDTMNEIVAESFSIDFQGNELSEYIGNYFENVVKKL